MNSVELRDKRAGLVAEARGIMDRAKAADRDMDNAEAETFDRAMAAADALKVKIDQHERLESAEGDLDARGERSAPPLDDRGARGHDGAAANGADLTKRRTAYRHWLRTGEVRQDLAGDQRRLGEFRDTITGTDAKGGYLVAPTQISDDIVKLIDDEVFIRKLAGVTTVTEAKKLGIRKLTTRMSDANWTTEVQAVAEDTAMAFDRRDLEPYLLSKLSKVSMRTLALSVEAEQLINEELAYKFGITEEKGFLTGSGVSQPLGLFTASASGISTARDVSTGNTTTALTADGLIDAKYAVKQAYLSDPKAGWIFHRDAIKMVRKLKNAGTGEYVWAAGLASGQPDRILDLPVYVSEYAPNTFTAGLYVGLVGNFRHYRIAEVNTMLIQRLSELYAGTNEVGFIGRRWVDGAPVLEEAFARVKLAAV